MKVSPQLIGLLFLANTGFSKESTPNSSVIKQLDVLFVKPISTTFVIVSLLLLISLMVLIILFLSYRKLEELNKNIELDLAIKNQKIAEYSYHLSHQIRGPIATLKGLIILSNESLIEDKECINHIKVCVEEIDNQIKDINSVLHIDNKQSFSEKNN